MCILSRDKVKCELRVASCKLRVASCKLRVAKANIISQHIHVLSIIFNTKIAF